MAKAKKASTKPVEKATPTAVTILDGDRVVRTYTPEAHGKDFVELAQGFANKKGYQARVESA
jgi:hypothetical protein